MALMAEEKVEENIAASPTQCPIQRRFIIATATAEKNASIRSVTVLSGGHGRTSTQMHEVWPPPVQSMYNLSAFSGSKFVNWDHSGYLTLVYPSVYCIA
nr:unnamed protein product [Callosobruchus chinensis]